MLLRLNGFLGGQKIHDGDGDDDDDGGELKGCKLIHLRSRDRSKLKTKLGARPNTTKLILP